jgi:hypothetical protein
LTKIIYPDDVNLEKRIGDIHALINESEFDEFLQILQARISAMVSHDVQEPLTVLVSREIAKSNQSVEFEGSFRELPPPKKLNYHPN